MRLIDADALRELYAETISAIANRPDMDGNLEYMIRSSAMAIKMIDDQQTVDAVPVVRCGECIHLSHDNIAPGWRRRCELWGDGKEESWFCADGEKVSE